ncbi:MAG: hypothetical protein ACTSP4_01370 [Candidatus Hodarchaeales archaeon]
MFTKDYIAFYIFDRHTGSNMFSRIFDEKFTVQPVLITGFLTGLYNFAEEVHLTKLEVINLQELRLVFQNVDNLIFALLTKFHVSFVDASAKINLLRSLFLSRFGEHFEGGKSPIRVDIFDEFEEVADGVLLGQSREIQLRTLSELKRLFSVLKRAFPGKHFEGALLSYTGEIIVKEMDDGLLHSVVSYLNLGYTTKIQAISRLIIESLDYKIILKQLGFTSTYLVVAIEKSVSTDKFIKVVDSIEIQLEEFFEDEDNLSLERMGMTDLRGMND